MDGFFFSQSNWKRLLLQTTTIQLQFSSFFLEMEKNKNKNCLFLPQQIICDANVYAEINQLKKALAESSQQLMAMEAACLQESNRHVELEDSLIAWQDKYERLHESHKRVQKINQSLEDKLLKLVDRNANERAQLTSDVATLSVRLAQANYNIGTLQREIVS